METLDNNTDTQTTTNNTNTQLNKSGNKRGCKDNNKQNFANDKQAASEAGKKSTSKSIVQAITKSDAVANGRHKQITPELRQFIRDELLAQGKNGTTYLQRFVKAFLNEAVTDMNSNPARLLSNAIFKDDFISQIDIDAVRAMNEDIDYKKYLIRSTLYDKQQEVYDDDISKGIIIINSRRSGKTELLGRLIVKGLLKPDAHVVYINRTSSAAIRQIRGPLQTALDKINLKCIKGSVDAQEMHFENGSQLLIIGNNNSADIDRVRGERISLCLCDEVGHQRNIRTLIRETISPALKDYADSQLIMVGTPPRLPHTYIEELWNNPEVSYKKWHWTFLDNPFIPNRETVIDDVCKEFGVNKDSPFIQREYYGIMGAYDTDAVVFKNPTVYDKLAPNATWYRAYIGVDFGFEDDMAVISAVVDKLNKKLYIVDEWHKNKCSVTDVATEIKRQYDNLKQGKYGAIATDVYTITDSNEKSIAFELIQTYHIKNVFCAYKYDKLGAIDQLATWMRTGNVVLPKDGYLHEETNLTLWKRDEETDKILAELDDDSYHANGLMALLYISRHFAYEVMGTETVNLKSVAEQSTK